MVNIKQVAVEAGVSTATISRVLTGNGYVSDEIKAKVLAAVEKLNYRPNAVARSLKQDKTNTIGVIIPDISNPFFMSVLRGVEDIVHLQGYNLIFSSSDENTEKERELLYLLQEKRVDALVLATAGQNDSLIANISKTGLPIVLLDRQVDGLDIELDLVAEDNLSAAYELTRRLLELGHTRIAVINGLLDVSTGRDRYAGYLKAIREAGISEEDSYIFDGGFSVEGGLRAIGYFMKLDPRPTAILSFNNNMTFGALQELTRMGLHVPKDMKLASYGQVEAALLLKKPEILFAEQLPYEMGRKIGETVLVKIQGSSEPVASSKFIITPEVKQI